MSPYIKNVCSYKICTKLAVAQQRRQVLSRITRAAARFNQYLIHFNEHNKRSARRFRVIIFLADCGCWWTRYY